MLSSVQESAREPLGAGRVQREVNTHPKGQALNPTTQGEALGHPWDLPGTWTPLVLFSVRERGGWGSLSPRGLPSGKHLMGLLQGWTAGREERPPGPWASEVGKKSQQRVPSWAWVGGGAR